MKVIFLQDVITSSSMLINNNFITKIKNNTKLETLKNRLAHLGKKMSEEFKQKQRILNTGKHHQG